MVMVETGVGRNNTALRGVNVKEFYMLLYSIALRTFLIFISQLLTS